MAHSGNITHSDIADLVRLHQRLVVCTVVRAQGSVPRRVGSRMVVLADGKTVGTVGGGLFESLVSADALAALGERQSRVKRYDFREVGASEEAFGAICGGNADLFLEVVTMPERLLIVGGGHCGRALARAAALLGNFTITVIDDRPEYAEQGDLPSEVAVELVPPEFPALASRVTPDTFVALVSQGAATDLAALSQVAESGAAYIGMMGSRKKVRTVLEALAAEGISAEALSRVHAPIGLDIHAETPAEIAVAILAQLISLRVGGAA
jgi:xanthine dehydrogenase accessory factor